MATKKNALYKVYNGTDFDEIHFKTNASLVDIQDAGNKIVATNVEGALQEIKTDFDNHLADYTLQVPYVVATGTANTYSATLNPAPTNLVNGLAVAVKIPIDSTGSSTLNVNGLGAKTIKKANGANVTNLKAGGIYTLRYDGVNFILQGEGASGNATASDLLSGKTATTDAGEIVGTMPNRGAINNTITTQNGQIIIPEGYHNGSGIVKATLPSKAAQTYTPGTTNQVISAGQYLAGNQTIAGSANLVPENIKSGVNIFGKVGTLSSVENLTLIAQGIEKGDGTNNINIQNFNSKGDLPPIDYFIPLPSKAKLVMVFCGIYFSSGGAAYTIIPGFSNNLLVEGIFISDPVYSASLKLLVFLRSDGLAMSVGYESRGDMSPRLNNTRTMYSWYAYA